MGNIDNEVVKHLLGETSGFDRQQTWEFTFVMVGKGRSQGEALEDALECWRNHDDSFSDSTPTRATLLEVE